MKSSQRIFLGICLFISLFLLGFIFLKFCYNPSEVYDSTDEEIANDTNNYNIPDEITINVIHEDESTDGKSEIYSIMLGSDYITQYALETENKLDLILSNPIEESIVESTPCAETQEEGVRLYKKLKYEGIEIILTASKKDEIFRIISIHVTSDKFVTPKGIKVRDNLETLKKVYEPKYLQFYDFKNTNPYNNLYRLNGSSGGTYDFLEFKVENGIVKEIIIEYDGP